MDSSYAAPLKQATSYHNSINQRGSIPFTDQQELSWAVRETLDFPDEEKSEETAQ